MRKKMKKINPIDLVRPDKLLFTGLKTLTELTLTPINMYADLKAKSKGKAEITFIGEKKLEEVKAQLFTFNESEVSESNEKDFSPMANPKDSHIHWLNIHGLHEVDLIQDLAKIMNLDRLSVRQLLDTTQRPKVEEFDDYLFFNIKSMLLDETDHMDVEQLSFILGKNYVVSFQEKESDHFDDIRFKIREGVGFVRKRSSDYLLIQLLDAILDNYFETIEDINEDTAELEQDVYKNPRQETLLELEKSKKRADLIKKSLTPFMESINYILNNRTSFFQKPNVKYINDLRMSCANALEEADSTARSLESLTNIYYASLSQKMNETMKVLTTVATIFIPLTFIAGIYGMNFQYMPELQYKNGYFIVWGVMIAIFIGMLIYFKRKKWL
ncbi:magnesium transporter [Ekhidna lutea]|uniref:Magnesium transport protein CorA n=1 Tax=Ekhidna lutea TaxID=447679 RepID=A0A239HTR7_EKHLU|nr:magnesium/cobalt transporter CorA [Ekhidna lutea]SNS84706.1 magnesium transporter [Ekhidna lutea]